MTTTYKASRPILPGDFVMVAKNGTVSPFLHGWWCRPVIAVIRAVRRVLDRIERWADRRDSLVGIAMHSANRGESVEVVVDCEAYHG